MNVLWTKDKPQTIFSTDNVVFHASGDGAGADATGGRCCRLCEGDIRLRGFGDSHMWQGVEERYDQLLYDCFGVRVFPSDSLICEWCVRQLRNANRFRAMVHAALGKPPSTNGSGSSNKHRLQEQEPAIISYKDIIELLNNKTHSETKSVRRMKDEKCPDSLGAKTNAQCVMCKQKYPRLLQSDGEDKLVCSRCKKNCEKRSVCRICNVAIPYGLMREHLGLHAKADVQRKSRIGLPKKPSLVKQDVLKVRSVPKYRCPVCPKIYLTTQHLAEHIKCIHGSGKKSFCEICGKDLKSNEPFEKHIKVHTEQILNYQCPPKLLKTKRASKTLHHFARDKVNV